jgi:tRNA threonylcarbamoyladenosine biosynthesis protein TsaE
MIKTKKTKYLSNNPEETCAIAKAIGQSLSGGEVLALYGDLGAGKTAFTQGLASGLEIKEKVNSPTFVIIKVYDSKKRKLKLCHIDAYRLENEKNLLDIGVENYLNQAQTVMVIEWADRVEKILPKDTIKIFFSNLGLDKREIVIKKYEL